MWITAEQAAAEEAQAFDTTLARLEREADRLDHFVSQYAKRGYTEKLEHAKAEYGVTRDAVNAMREYYQIKRWTRYYQVPDGKIHRSMGCQSCNHFYISTGYSSTQFVWLTDCSGKTATDMIKTHGTAMCSICFPDAPLDPEYQAAAKKTAAEKDAARDAKAAARQAKLDATPKGDDGQPLKVGSDTPKTARGARNAMSSRMKDVIWYTLAAEHHGTPRTADHLAADAAQMEDCRTICRSLVRLNLGADVDPAVLNTTAEAVYTDAWERARRSTAAEWRKAMKDPRNQ